MLPGLSVVAESLGRELGNLLNSGFSWGGISKSLVSRYVFLFIRFSSRVTMFFRNKFGFRNNQSRRPTSRRPKFFDGDRSLRLEGLEGRLVLSASGFVAEGNECAPVIDNVALMASVPTEDFSPGDQISFSFDAATVVEDEGLGLTPASAMQFILDPDIESRQNGASPMGASLTNTTGTTWDFAWTPTVQQQGTYTLFIIATDDGGASTGATSPVPLSDAFSFSLTINNTPSVDLNGVDVAGDGFAALFTEGDDPVAIVAAGNANEGENLSIPFVQGDTVLSATVQIDPATLQADGLEALGIDTSGTLLEVDTANSTADTLVIVATGGGEVDKSEFEQALRTLTYGNTSDDPVDSQSILVTINDGNSDSAVATATVEITAVNDRPNLLQPTDALPAAMVGTPYVLELVAEDPDGGDLLVFQLDVFPTGAVITPNSAGSGGSTVITTQVARDPADGLFKATIEWTPEAEQGDENGEVLFTVLVTDSQQSADVENYTVTIENQAPDANADPASTPADETEPFGVDEDTARDVGNIFTNDEDVDGDTFTLNSVIVDGSEVADPMSFMTFAEALVTISAEGVVNYDPNGKFESLSPNETATDSFQYTITDDSTGGVSELATVTITIFGNNDAPTMSPGASTPVFNLNEDADATELSLATFLAAIEDVDNDDSELSIVAAPDDPTSPAAGAFSLDGGILTFDPDQAVLDLAVGVTETVDFQVLITDGGTGDPVTLDAQIIITGVNDPPVAVADSSGYETDEETQLDVPPDPQTVPPTVGLLDNDTDDAGATLTVASVNGTAIAAGQTDVTVTLPDDEGEVTVNEDGTFSFTPGTAFDSLAEGDSDTATFEYTATDGNSESNTATVTITVNGVNDAPMAADVAASATEDGDPVQGNLAGTDVDDDDASLTYAIDQDLGAGEGSVQIVNDNMFEFDPGDDFQELAEGVEQEVTFTYKAMDAALESLEGTVTVTVTGENDAPVIDLSETTGVASALPGGIFDDVNSTIDLVIDLSSADINESSINMLDLKAFASDRDGDALAFAADFAQGTSFGTNVPDLTDGVLSWTPTTNDVDAGYIIRVTGLDMPPGNVNAKPLNQFDIQISVIEESNDAPTVVSVPEAITFDPAEEFTFIRVEFNEAIGDSALETTNYSLVGFLNTTEIPVIISGITREANSDNAVLLSVQRASLSSLSSLMLSEIELTVDSAVQDLEGLGVEGQLVFDISFGPVN